MRWAKKRDANEPVIFSALQMAGCSPIRLTDIDIVAEHVEGRAVLIEVKTKQGRMRELQVKLKALFKDQYHVCRDPESALAACGIQVRSST